MSDQPTGWVTASLISLVSSDGLFTDGDWVESKDQDPRGDIRLLQLADIGDGRFLDKSARFINDEKFVELRCTELTPGDVLVARMPDPLGRACLMPRLPQRCITVVDVAALRPGKQSVLPVWLMHTINSPQFRDAIAQQASGTTRKRISRGNLAKLCVPVPPRPEQQRIAEKLDNVLARVDACRDRLARVAPLLKRFRQSVLAAATSGGLTSGAQGSYPSVALSRLLQEPLRNGKSVVDGTGVRVLRLSSLGDREVKLTENKRGEWSGIEVGRYLIHAGDFLVARGNGSRELVGRGALVSTEPAESVAFPDTMIRVRPELSLLNPHYLRAIWDGAEVRRQIEASARTTAGIYKISQTDLDSLEIPLPPLNEQSEIVRRIETLFAFADRLEARLAQAQTAVDRLTPSLLAKAFRGELVPQDPNDEPASALLARIAAARSAAPPTSRTRSPRAGGAPRAPKESATMTKSRQDDDVMGQPYLAGHLRRIGTPATAEVLFKVAELPVGDFYKQLAWEVAQGHVKDNQATLEPGHAAG